MQTLLAMSLFTITAACMAVGIGTFLLTISMTNDIKDDLFSINKNAKSKRKRSSALKQLSKLIQFHSDAKRLGKCKCVPFN